MAAEKKEEKLQWRVFYTAPRAEKKCEGRLLQQQIDIFLPKRVVVRQWKDRKKKVVEPLFPNYLFAHVDEPGRLQVLRTPGIVRCVSFGGALASLSEEEIDQLKITQNDPARLLPVDFPLPLRGTRVTVTEGPLKGLRGEVVSHRGDTHLILHVPGIRQAVRVNVPAAWTRPEQPLTVG